MTSLYGPWTTSRCTMHARGGRQYHQPTTISNSPETRSSQPVLSGLSENIAIRIVTLFLITKRRKSQSSSAAYMSFGLGPILWSECHCSRVLKEASNLRSEVKNRVNFRFGSEPNLHGTNSYSLPRPFRVASKLCAMNAEGR